MLTMLLQLSNEAHVSEDERSCFCMIRPDFTKTRFNNFRGTKDPLDSAKAFVRILEAEKKEPSRHGLSGNSRKGSSEMCLGGREALLVGLFIRVPSCAISGLACWSD